MAEGVVFWLMKASMMSSPILGRKTNLGKVDKKMIAGFVRVRDGSMQVFR